MYNTLYDTIDYKGFTIEIHHDLDPLEPVKEHDSFGKWALFHKRYNLPNTDNIDLEDAMDIKASKDYVSLTIFGYNHSGLSISASREYPYNCPWDSGVLGIIYVSKEDICKEFNVKRVTAKTLKKVFRLLYAEVSTYSDYLTGNVYGFVIKKGEDDECVDSCWGYYGDPKTSGLIEDAKGAINHELAQQEEYEALL